MAYSANIGEMRTKIRFYELKKGRDTGGFPTEVLTDIFNAPCWCKWVNTHGSELSEDMRQELRETATLTMHYSSKINIEQVIVKDNIRYEIISLNNVEEKDTWLEIKVKRRAVE